MEARYLNVDCILRSDHSLDDLVSFLDNDIFVLWSDADSGSYSIGFETKLINTKNPCEDISNFLDMFESLPPTLASLVKSCNEKAFDIGFESVSEGEALDILLDSSLLIRLSVWGFNVGIRIYPVNSAAPISESNNS